MNQRKKQQQFCFLQLFDRFIQDCRKGRRLQPSGKKISKGTIQNYQYTRQLLEKFAQDKNFSLRIYQERYLSQRESEREKNYWKKFYIRFTDYLYNKCGYFDNYVGQNIKNIKVFFNYLNTGFALGVGQFHKQFYVRKEQIPIYPLMPEELNFLICDSAFEASLSFRMKEVKDFFVFGCTVALRVSDLLALRRSNIRVINGQFYLSVRSQKTATDSLVKLPPYAVDILHKYQKKGGKILPHFNKSNLNQYIKQLLEKAGFTQEVISIRERRGKAVPSGTNVLGKKKRLCDIASTHTMRRTAITTMLCLGVPEGVVRKISGHAPNTKEFYRYVSWAQAYQDKETDKAFSLLQAKKWTA